MLLCLLMVMHSLIGFQIVPRSALPTSMRGREGILQVTQHACVQDHGRHAIGSLRCDSQTLHLEGTLLVAQGDHR